MKKDITFQTLMYTSLSDYSENPEVNFQAISERYHLSEGVP